MIEHLCNYCGPAWFAWQPHPLLTGVFGCLLSAVVSPSLATPSRTVDRSFDRRRLTINLTLLTFVLATIYEALKEFVFPDISKWESHGITIAVATICAFFVARHVLRQIARQEQTTVDSEVLHRTVLTSISEAVFITDRTGRFLYVCPNAYSFFNIDEHAFARLENVSELLGDRLFDPAELEKAGAITNLELELVGPDGVRRDLLVSARLVPVMGGGVLYTCRDITRYNETTRTLRKNERTLRALIEASTDRVVLIDPVGVILAANRSFGETIGRDAAGLVGCDVFTLFQPDVAAVRRRRFDEAVQGKRPLRFFDERDGITLDTVLSPVLDDTGQVEMLAVYARDITELVRTKEAIQLRSHELGERVKELQCLYSMSRLIESPERDLQVVFRHMTAIIPRSWQYPEVTCCRLRYLDQVFLSQGFQESPWRQEADLVVDDKLCGSVEVFYTEECPASHEGPFLLEERKLIDEIADRLSWFIEHRQAAKAVAAGQELLHRERERLFNLLEQLPAFVYVQRPDYVIDYANRTVRATFGDVQGRLCYECFHGRTQPCDPCPSFSVFATGKPAEWEWTCPTGQVLKITDFPFTDADGSPLVIELGADITELKRLELELRQARDEAEAASRAKSDFLARMSHEIRTPMNTIVNMTQLAMEGVSPAKRQEYLTLVEKSSQHLLTVINDILDVSKIEAGRLALESHDFDLPELMAATLATLRVQAEHKGLHLHLSLAPTVPRYVKGDSTRLRQIVINLVSNAVKFTPHGAIEVSLRPLPPRRRDQDLRQGLLFEIRDSGIGIPQDKQRQVFSRFSQADDSITRKYGGTGLGLTICRQLVELMDGCIWLRSRPGLGSAFSFFVFLAPGKPVSECESPETAVASRHGLRVLLAEDNPMNVCVARALLDKLGHTTVHVESGSDVLIWLAHERFDLVLMDLEMPGMDGLEATRRIRAGEAGAGNVEIPVIALTAHAVSGYRDRCQAAGMNDFLAKPIIFGELKTLLGRHAPAEAPEPEAPTPPEDNTRGIDRISALDRLDGDETLFLQVVRLFLDESPARLDALPRLVQSRDWNSLQRAAHSFKSSSATLGAMELSKRARDLEELLAAGSTESATQAIELLVAEFRRTRPLLVALLPPHARPEAPLCPASRQACPAGDN